MKDREEERESKDDNNGKIKVCLCYCRVMDRLNLLLDTVDVNVRITVGEVLALVYELGREYDDQFVGDTNGLNEALKELATDGNKHRAKKDRRQQRSSFRFGFHNVPGVYILCKI